jgi:asparagine synthase (glutamine-hydrolysing)
MWMTLPRAVYLLARRHRVKAVLDGIDGDSVLAEGSYIPQLVRSAHLLTAWREAAARHEFEGGGVPPWRILAGCVARSIAPPAVRRRLQYLREAFGRDAVQRNLETSIASREFAQRVHLGDRLEALRAHTDPDLSHDLPAERARAASHPFVTVAVERYERTASALGIEARHPFLDRQLVEYCIALPGSQKLAGGWPKAILRSAMAGRLPDSVRWRPGKQHLGWSFNAALMSARHDHIESLLHDHADVISAYVDATKVRAAWHGHLAHSDPLESERVLEAVTLMEWLLQHGKRPIPD